MKSRNQVDEKYKWTIEGFETEDKINAVFDIIDEMIEKAPYYYGKLNNKDVFFDYFLSNKEKLVKIQQLGCYIYNTISVDNSNTDILKLDQRYSNAMTKYDKAYSFISSQLSDLPDEYLNELLLDPRAKEFDNVIKDIIKNKPHKLDEHTNKILSSLSNSFNNSSNVFHIIKDSELTFEDVKDSNGKTYKVDNSTLPKLLTNKDRTLRKNAFNSRFEGYKKFNKTFAELFISSMKSEKDFYELKKWNSLLESALEGEDVPLKVFENNIKYTTENIHLVEKFLKSLKKDLNLKDFAYYDLWAENKIKTKISIENGQNLILEALKPLGDEYLNLVRKKLKDKSIDYLPNKNKYSGAYCSGNFGSKTVILLNWSYDFDSVNALIHEMGHCINNEYYQSAQPFYKADTTIFAAEIASTVNETLLNQYMIKNCKNSEKKYYLKEFLENVRGTIFRQTMFTEFELFIHDSIKNEIPLTYKEINEKYYELTKKYYRNSCKIPESIKYEWAAVPHFYSPFYVYSYSTGLITALCIASKILKEKGFNEKYIYFLKNGNNKPAVEILKEIGIDLTTPAPFVEAFKFIEEQVKKYQAVVKNNNK